MRMDSADGGHAALEGIVAATLKTDWAGFGHAISDRHFAHVHVGDDALHHFDGTRGSRHHAGAQRAQVVVAKLRMIELRDEHRWYAVKRRALLGRNRFQHSARLE